MAYKKFVDQLLNKSTTQSGTLESLPRRGSLESFIFLLGPNVIAGVVFRTAHYRVLVTPLLEHNLGFHIHILGYWKFGP